MLVCLGASLGPAGQEEEARAAATASWGPGLHGESKAVMCHVLRYLSSVGIFSQTFLMK